MAWTIPDGMPMLSPGKHRNPAKGACFMEYASYLAGERWSDQPACTHPMLALLARLTNDAVDDRHRSALVELIPEVVGVTTQDLTFDLTLSVRMAEAALPIAPYERQRTLGVGLLAVEELLPLAWPSSASTLEPRIRAAFATAPDVEGWARAYRAGLRLTEKIFREKTGPGIAINAGLGIARACVDDPQERLVALLRACIADGRAVVAASTPRPTTARRPLVSAAAGAPTDDRAGASAARSRWSLFQR